MKNFCSPLGNGSSPSRLIVVGLLVVLWGCSSHTDATVCEDSTFLGFEPALSADGEYEITVDVDGVQANCRPQIVDGQLQVVHDCSIEGARPGLEGFALVAGGQVRTETDTDVHQSSPRSVAGIEWSGKSSSAAVVLKRDGVEISTGQVSFQSDPSYGADECTAVRMAGSITTN